MMVIVLGNNYIVSIWSTCEYVHKLFIYLCYGMCLSTFENVKLKLYDCTSVQCKYIIVNVAVMVILNVWLFKQPAYAFVCPLLHICAFTSLTFTYWLCVAPLASV